MVSESPGAFILLLKLSRSARSSFHDFKRTVSFVWIWSIDHASLAVSRKMSWNIESMDAGDGETDERLFSRQRAVQFSLLTKIWPGYCVADLFFRLYRARIWVRVVSLAARYGSSRLERSRGRIVARKCWHSGRGQKPTTRTVWTKHCDYRCLSNPNLICLARLDSVEKRSQRSRVRTAKQLPLLSPR